MYDVSVQGVDEHMVNVDSLTSVRLEQAWSWLGHAQR